MGERLRAVSRAIQTTWGLVTVVLMLFAILVTLAGIYMRMGTSDATAKCRSQAAAILESANVERDNARSDADETVLRLFDASFKRDTAAIEAEGAKLPALFTRIHEATVAIVVANDQRLASIDKCTKG